MDTNFSHEQSLSLINEMICRARSNVKHEGAPSLIYWGYVTAILAIIQSVLLITLDQPQQSQWVWSLMIPAFVVSYFMQRRIIRKRLVKTHIDKIAGIVWGGFLISYVVFEITILSTAYRFNTQIIFLLNIPVIMIMLGLGQFISACIYRNKMWYAIAALTWIGAVICVFLPLYGQFIDFAICMILGFVVPGHVLVHQAMKSHV
jgi:hypothetical protein